MRCFCFAVLCYGHRHVHLFQRQEGEEEGYACAEGGKGSPTEGEIWYLLMEIVLFWVFR